MHHDIDEGTGWVSTIPLTMVSILVVGYLLALALRRRSLPPWPVRRTTMFLTGCCMLGLAFIPAVVSWSGADFRGHMAQHLVVGMAAPLALVLGAPVTLLLGSVSQRTGRGITRLLRTRVVYLLTRPWLALTLMLAPMAALYFTPLYGWAMASPWSHLILHAHFLASGCLFAWVVAGLDPAPHRASVRSRIVTIGVAVVIHATISQLMYAGIGLQVQAPPQQVRDAAALMYFGGDLIEILLAVALLSQWRSSGRRPSTSTHAGQSVTLPGTSRPGGGHDASAPLTDVHRTVIHGEVTSSAP